MAVDSVILVTGMASIVRGISRAGSSRGQKIWGHQGAGSQVIAADSGRSAPGRSSRDQAGRGERAEPGAAQVGGA